MVLILLKPETSSSCISNISMYTYLSYLSKHSHFILKNSSKTYITDLKMTEYARNQSSINSKKTTIKGVTMMVPRIVCLHSCELYSMLLSFWIRKFKYGIWQMYNGATILNAVKVVQARCSDWVNCIKI